MSVIDDHLKKMPPEKRKELARIRKLAKEIVPKTEESIMYGMPTLKVDGKPYLGFDAHANHIGIYPYSGQVIPLLKKELAGYGKTKGAVRVPLDAPIPKSLLKKIIACRLRMIR